MIVGVYQGADGGYRFVTDPTKGNLPSANAPWRLFKTIDMNRDEAPRAGVNTNTALNDIAAKGWHEVSWIALFGEPQHR